MPRSWVLMNSDRVWIFASGKRASACFNSAVVSLVTPLLVFTNANRFCGFAYSRSKRGAEIVTSPHGEPPFGGPDMAEHSEPDVGPAGVFRQSGESGVGGWSPAYRIPPHATFSPSCVHV